MASVGDFLVVTPATQANATLGQAYSLCSVVRGSSEFAQQKLGGAKVILATVTRGDAMSAVLDGLGINGTLIVVGAADSIQVSPMLLLSRRRSVKGSYSGTAIDSQDTLEFSVLAGVRSMNETYPLEKWRKLTSA